MRDWMPGSIGIDVDERGNMTFQVRRGEPMRVDAADSHEFFRLVDLVRGGVLARTGKKEE